MYSPDKNNYKEFLKKFPNQIAESENIVKKSHLNINHEKINKIIYLGMGGSAIAGDIFKDIYFKELAIPLEVVRGYEIPGCCDENSLVIVSSYSGNTEETISSVKGAVEKKAQILAITTGGEVLNLAKEFDWSYVVIPEGFPPRQAFGYSFFPLLYVLNELGIVSISDKQIQSVNDLINKIVKRNDDQTAEGKILSKDLAIRIHNKIPIVYSGAPYMNAIASRWKNQFQENSKSMAISNVLPEMNHNEIVGWEMDVPMMNNFFVIFLKSNVIHPRTRARIELTKNMIKDRGVEVVEIYSEGKNLLENVVSLVAIGDWVSYYLALLYEKDPASIINIDYLKSELKKIK